MKFNIPDSLENADLWVKKIIDNVFFFKLKDLKFIARSFKIGNP